MNTDGLNNPTGRRAIEALQQGDRKAWAALFEPHARLYDDRQSGTAMLASRVSERPRAAAACPHRCRTRRRRCL